MNHQTSVVNSLVTNQPIPPANSERKDLYNTHKSLNFYDLLARSSYQENTDYFLHHEGITFREHVGRQLMTGNDLLYYPELAKQLREIADYPVLKHSHKQDKNIQGLEFLKYFCHYVDEQFKKFDVELGQLSQQVNELIDLYGQKRYLPLIDNLEFVRYQATYAIKNQAIIINGVKWPVRKSKWEKPENCPRETDYLNLHQLLNISPEIEQLYLEDFLANSPFIQVRLVKTWKHKGQLKWYNLDTCQPVSKTEVVCWVKPA